MIINTKVYCTPMHKTVCSLSVTCKGNPHSLLGSYCVSGLIMTGQERKNVTKNYVNLQDIDTKQCWVETALDSESMGSMLLVDSNAENKCVD